MENPIITSQKPPAREIKLVTAEIIELRRQAQCMALAYIVEIGRRLVEAKSILPHGEWGQWLKEEVDFSQSTANSYMKLFDEYGSTQMTLFGAFTNSQSFANLPYTKALQLLAVPAEEREEFAEKVDAEHISVSQLKEAIKEREAAIAEAEKQKALNAELEEKLSAAERAKSKAEDSDKAIEDLTKTVENLKADLAKANKEADEAKVKLKEAKKNPKIPPAELKRIEDAAKATAEKAAQENAKAALEDAQKRLSNANAAKELAEQAWRKAERELSEVRNKLKTAGPEVSAFKELFDITQQNIQKLKAKLSKIKETDPETAEKLTGALKALAGMMKGE